MCIKSIKVCIHRELYFKTKSWRMSQFRSNSYCPNEKNKQMIKFGKTTETVTKYDAESIARFMGQALKHSRIEYRLILYLVLYYWALHFLALLKLYQPIFFLRPTVETIENLYMWSMKKNENIWCGHNGKKNNHIQFDSENKTKKT